MPECLRILSGLILFDKEKVRAFMQNTEKIVFLLHAAFPGSA
jgi:hypothetical protein